MKSRLLPFILCAGLLLVVRAFAADPAPAYTRTIYLIRHGAYDTSDQGDEETARGLTPLGIAEARLIAARLRGMPVDFDSLVSSTFTRARQTADVINQSIPKLHHETTKLLCECLPPMREQPTGTDVDAGGKQLDAAFAQYFIPATDHDRHDILVCHGNVIRYLVMKALGVEATAWTSFNVAHCSLTIIQVKPNGTCSVLSVGDTGHLPPNLTTGYSRHWPELVAP